MPDSQYNSVNEQRREQLNAWLESVAPDFKHIKAIAADAGTRRYYRLFHADSTLIAVDANPAFEDNATFIDIAARITNTGLHTPVIYHYNPEMGFLLLEDLGERHLQQWLIEHPSSVESMYQLACDAMIILQEQTDTAGMASFNRDFILFELDIFAQWYIDKHLQYRLTGKAKRVLSQLNETLVENCESQPQAFMHRDFHSRNLMVTGPADIAIIDFQGALRGPVTYDLASLLKDAYVETNTALEQQLREHHRSVLHSAALPVTRELYDRWYRLTALQRHLKIMGLFCRLNYRDHKPQYLAHLNTVADHIRETLALYSEFTHFRDLFDSLTSLHRK